MWLLRKAGGNKVPPAFGTLASHFLEAGPKGPTYILMQDLELKRRKVAEATKPLTPGRANTKERTLGSSLDMAFFSPPTTVVGEAPKMPKGPKAPVCNEKVTRPLRRGAPLRPGLPGLGCAVAHNQASAPEWRLLRLQRAAEGVLSPRAPLVPGLVDPACR